MSYGDSTGAGRTGKAPVLALLLDTREGFWNEVALFRATVYVAVTTQPPLSPPELLSEPGSYYLVLSAQVSLRNIRYFIEAMPGLSEGAGLSILDAQAQPEATREKIEARLQEVEAEAATHQITVHRGRWEVIG